MLVEMYKLIGDFSTLFGVEYQVIVARFSSLKAAEEYLSAASLENGFRKDSLLKDADHAWIEVEEVNLDIPVNPVLND